MKWRYAFACILIAIVTLQGPAASAASDFDDILQTENSVHVTQMLSPCSIDEDITDDLGELLGDTSSANNTGTQASRDAAYASYLEAVAHGNIAVYQSGKGSYSTPYVIWSETKNAFHVEINGDGVFLIANSGHWYNELHWVQFGTRSDSYPQSSSQCDGVEDIGYSVMSASGNQIGTPDIGDATVSVVYSNFTVQKPLGYEGPDVPNVDQTITASVDCTPGPVAGVWIVNTTDSSRSGWATVVSRGTNDASITYGAAHIGDSWGANIGCGIENDDYNQWQHSTSTFNTPFPVPHTTIEDDVNIICLAGYTSSTGNNGCFFN